MAKFVSLVVASHWISMGLVMFFVFSSCIEGASHVLRSLRVFIVVSNNSCRWVDSWVTSDSGTKGWRARAHLFLSHLYFLVTNTKQTFHCQMGGFMWHGKSIVYEKEHTTHRQNWIYFQPSTAALTQPSIILPLILNLVSFFAHQVGAYG